MFKFIQKSKETESVTDMTHEEYARTLQNIFAFAALSENTEDKIRALDYVLSVFRVEYAVRTRSRLFRHEKSSPIADVFPHRYRNVDGALCTLSCSGQKEIELDDGIAVSAWNQDRLSGILPVIQCEGFIEHPDNHHAWHYPYIGLTIVTNGNHSISAGCFLGSGSIHAYVYDLTELFDHIDTDGEKWIDKHIGIPFASVGDRYIALLYTIAQMKYSYERTCGDHLAEQSEGCCNV